MAGRGEQGTGYPWPAGEDRTTRLDRDDIVRAALVLLDEEGLDQFSTRKLATRLGIKSPSLYWHIKNKEELFALLIDHVVGSCELPPRGIGWQDQLHRIAHDLRNALIAHPAIADLLLGRLMFGPNGLRLADHIIGAMRDHGFSDQLAAYGHTVFVNYVIGFAGQETAFGKGPAGKKRLEQVRQFLKELPAEQYPDLTAVAPVLSEGRFTDRFELGLTAILDRLDKQRTLPAEGAVVRRNVE